MQRDLLNEVREQFFMQQEGGAALLGGDFSCAAERATQLARSWLGCQAVIVVVDSHAGSEIVAADPTNGKEDGDFGASLWAHAREWLRDETESTVEIDAERWTPPGLQARLALPLLAAPIRTSSGLIGAVVASGVPHSDNGEEGRERFDLLARLLSALVPEPLPIDALLQTPILMIRLRRDGVISEIDASSNPNVHARGAALRGVSIAQLCAPQVAEEIVRTVAQVLDDDTPRLLEFSEELGGVNRAIEVRLARFSADEVLLVRRDTTDNRLAVRGLHERDRLFRALIDGMNEGVFLYDILRSKMLYVSPVVESIVGLSSDALERQHDLWVSHVHEADRHTVTTALEAALNGSGGETEFRLERPGSTPRWARLRLFPIGFSAAGVDQVAGLLEDITIRKGTEIALRESEARLRESEERYALAVSGANDGIWDWNLIDHKLYLSPRWKEMLGFGVDELPNATGSWFGRVSSDDLHFLQAAIDAHIRGHTDHLEVEHRVLHRDGTLRWMLCRGLATRDAEGRARRMAGSFTDITARKRAEERLIHEALHDPLTGLPNRTLFMDRLERALQRFHRRSELPFSVLFIDLDGFKMVNDSLGHSSGDRLLIAFARRLQQGVPTGHTCARLGGDEFAVLLEDIESISFATDVAEAIQDLLALPFDLDGHDVYSSASIGIAMSAKEYARADELLRDADTAMYRAKTSGKAQHQVFDIGMHTQVVDRLQLLTGLQLAVERREFELYYQPIVVLQGGVIVGFEALLRWNHPERGMVLPESFIGLSEESGLITEIGWQVLVEACRQARKWQKATSDGELTMSVNLSAKQLQQPDLTARIARVLEVTGVVPRTLCLEITESTAMGDVNLTIRVLKRLKALGIRLAIDDFGTGYSSLSYLHRFPIDALKIDRSFVSHAEGGENLEIIRTIVSLAKNLQLGVTAEGVETREQMVQLRALDCTYAQGYYFARPLPAAKATELLEESATNGGAVVAGRESL